MGAYCRGMQKNSFFSGVVLGSAALALVLAGCGSSEQATEGAPKNTETVSTSTPSEKATTQTLAGSSPTASADSAAGATTKGGDGDSAQNAIETAQSEVGGQATDIDFDDDDKQWDLTLVNDGKATEVTVNADGGDVLQQDNDDTLEADDQQEFDTAQITLADAVNTATAERSGTINDAELTQENNMVVYKVDLYTGADNSEVTILVDATNGDIVTTR